VIEDLFLLHVAGDEAPAAVLAEELYTIGVTSVTIEILQRDTTDPIPDLLAQRLPRARFGVVMVSRRFPLVTWPELDSTLEQLIVDHIVFICEEVQVSSLRRMTPASERFEAVESHGDWNFVAGHLASILKADPESQFAKSRPLRRIFRFTPKPPATPLPASPARSPAPTVPLPAPSGPIRIFVSSTFRDMHAERDLLGRFVFPQLREHCQSAGVEIAELDLRWGVTEQEIERGELLKRCLNEIDKCSRYFVVILGDRYGECVDRIAEPWLQKWPFLRSALGMSVMDIEVTYGAFRPETLPLFFARLPTYGLSVPPSERSAFQANDDAKTRLEHVKSRIRAAGHPLIDYATPEEFAYLALNRLKEMIDADLPRQRRRPASPVELPEQQDLMENVSRNTIEREDLHGLIDAHVSGSLSPLLLTGASGNGKTVALAQWAHRHKRLNPEAIIVFVSAEASRAATVDWFMLGQVEIGLTHLLGLADFKPRSVGSDKQIDEIVAEWQRRSGRRDRPIIVFDAPDRLKFGFSRQMTTISPRAFGISCQFICSLDDPTSLDIGEYTELVVEGFTPDQRRALASTFLSRYGKHLPEAALALIEQSPQTASPRFLTMLLNELRLFGDHARVVDQLRRFLECETDVSLLELVLARLEECSEIERPNLVRDAMVFIWVSNRGINEKHLLSLLGGVHPLPDELWAPIRISLAESLHTTITGLEFRHAAIREAVRRRYLSHRDSVIPYHRRLAMSLISWGGSEESFDFTTGLLEQLDAGECWSQLAFFLGQENYLCELWSGPRSSPTDVITYWDHLEASSTHNMLTTYKSVIERPEIVAPKMLQTVADLFLRRSAKDIVLTMVERLEQCEVGASATEETVSPSRLVRLLVLLREWDLAASHLRRQRLRCENAGISAELADIIREQAHISDQQGHYEQALEQFREAESISRTLESSDGVRASLWGQERILRRLGRLAEAEQCERNALRGMGLEMAELDKELTPRAIEQT